ncbi:HlyD family type I secretion periplasmic adaptor subunit [Roseovarius sp. E0-M6]|uniref:HlyD family type I secretion periplasmic adaptor subunit n=1 Tax=Roseovarius sp. E0-M6 TaxID=3127118 RepID=UPI003010178A
MSASVQPSLLSRLRGPLLLAALILIGFFAGIGVWSAKAPLTSAAVAPGAVGLEAQRKVVQHLEGGIIDGLPVTEGDRVQAGDLLISLDDTMARSTLELLEGQYIALLAQRARLKAERTGAEELTVPSTLEPYLGQPRAQKALAAERELLQSRHAAYASRLEILASKIDKLRERIKGLDAQADALRRQIRLIRQERDNIQDLVDRGLERSPRLFALQREEAEIEGLLGELAARRAETEVQIGESRLERVDLDARRINQVTGELSDLEPRLADMLPRLRAATDTLARTRITAPVDGTVIAMAHHTPGGVVAPGRPILEIVPAEMDLMIEARVPPSEIDVVRVGLPAEIRFTAFSARSTPTAPGRVVHVSADRLIDPATTLPYYAIHVRLDRTAAQEAGPGLDLDTLYPGMPVEVMVVTGRQSVLNYFLQPLSNVIARAFRES